MCGLVWWLEMLKSKCVLPERYLSPCWVLGKNCYKGENDGRKRVSAESGVVLKLERMD